MAASRPPPHLKPHLLIPHSTPLLILIPLLILQLPSASFAVNVTVLLSPYPDLSSFTRLLSSSPVASDLSRRSSLTLLAVPNRYLSRLSPDSSDLPDALRFHVLLQFLSYSDLLRLPPSGQLFTTLFQTTGRAPANLGALNLSRDPLSHAITASSPSSKSNATLLALVASLPYNVSVFSVSALLSPSSFDLAASDTRPSPPPPVNITDVLLNAHDFNVVASMLAASGVVDEFESDEKGAGITVFVPTDEAFAGLPATDQLQSLPADRKAAVLRFHVLHSYYPLGSLESIVNPVQPTLATEGVGAGRFTLNISRVNGSVAIDTGIVQASITRTVFDQNPVAVFAVSRVLLPREIFGRGAAGEATAAAPPVEERGIPPAVAESPPARLNTSPPGFKGEDVLSGSAAVAAASGGDGILICIAVLLCLLLGVQI